MCVKMGKTPFNLYIDGDIKERFTREFSNASDEIQHMMEQRLEAASGIEGKIRELKSDIEDEEERLRELRDKKNESERRLDRLEDELEILEMQKQDIDDAEEEVMPKFEAAANSFIGGSEGGTYWRGPDDISDYFVENLNYSREELWEMAKEVAEADV